jgi:selenocysteine lyase/cysteine desulfurase
MSPLFDPADFRLPDGVTHVCAAGETPFLKRHARAFEAYAQDKSLGHWGRAPQEAQIERAREGAAAMWGVQPGDIGFVSNVVEGVAMVVESLDWQPGDNVVVDPDEYPSDVGPLALRRNPRIELRLADVMDPAAVAAQVDARTRMIVVSAVSYLNAQRPDVLALRRVADGVGALLVVDFTQGAGWMPIDASVADFAFSACYKWMLGTTGVAIAYWNRARQPGWSPASAGWFNIAGNPIIGGGRPDYVGGLQLKPDAMRFTRGNPAHAPIYVLNEAMDYLRQHDVQVVQAHVQRLTSALLARLAQHGIASTTPQDPARHGASVCVEHPRADAVVEAMYARGVWAWGGRGRIRISFHGYNGGEAVDQVAQALLASLPG